MCDLLSVSIVKRETFKTIFRLSLFCWQHCVLNSIVIECPLSFEHKLTLLPGVLVKKIVLFEDINNYDGDL
jgi:hypothetical protein